MIQNVSVKFKLFLVNGLLLGLAICMALLGLGGMYSAKEGLRTVYEDRVVALKQLKMVSDLYAVNIVDTAHKVRNKNLDFPTALKSVQEAGQESRRNGRITLQPI